MTPELRALTDALLSERSIRPYVPEDPEAAAVKTKRLRALRLAKESAVRLQRTKRA